MRLLAGDIGGTKTLLHCVETDGTVVRTERYESGTWPTFDALLREFLAEGMGPVDSACFAVAGPVLGGRAEVTNVGWVMEEQALAAAFPIGRVSLINDFYAIGLGVPLLQPGDLLSLQQGRRDRTAPIAILGAGTGLGEALVVNIGGAYHVIPGEGGHGDFSPQNEEQARLFLHLQKQFGGHVSSERVISGTGLVNIFTFLGGDEIDAAEIAERADAGDPIAVRTFAMFVDAYGAEAGDVALHTLARGGVYLAGGVAAKNTRWFTDGAFVDAFTRKGRFSDVMRTMPVDLILNEEVGLIGAVHWAGRTMNDER